MTALTCVKEIKGKKNAEMWEALSSGQACRSMDDLRDLSPSEENETQEKPLSYHITTPPSILIDWPVIYAASGVQRYAMNFPISSSEPGRFSGTI